MTEPPVTVTVGGREISLSNLNKVLWPATGFTKGQLIDYYSRVAPVMVPHLSGRALTLKRYPNGVAAASFFEKNCPKHRPPWVPTAEMGEVGYCLAEEAATLVWMANLAAIELHPTLGRVPALDQPTCVVFDLDPGPPADVLTCARVGLILHDLFDQMGLQAYVKTSGSKGLQLYLPIAGGSDFERTKSWCQALAKLLERTHPDLVVSVQDKSKRPGKVLLDWGQNAPSKTTVSVYSVRARDEPTVSTPVTWEEVESALNSGDAGELRFLPDEVLDRIATRGDLMAPVLEGGQELPDLQGPAAPRLDA
ncbi:MAG: non-homologous end-joining DNA ligase [Acidimicrobiales bacterium]